MNSIADNGVTGSDSWVVDTALTNVRIGGGIDAFLLQSHVRIHLDKYSAPGGTRTLDTFVRSQVDQE